MPPRLILVAAASDFVDLLLLDVADVGYIVVLLGDCALGQETLGRVFSYYDVLLHSAVIRLLFGHFADLLLGH